MCTGLGLHLEQSAEPWCGGTSWFQEAGVPGIWICLCCFEGLSQRVKNDITVWGDLLDIVVAGVLCRIARRHLVRSLIRGHDGVYF